MATDTNQPPQAWTCAKCGAALPVEAGTGEVIICGYCGTPFKLPVEQTRTGGVDISGGPVFIGGDVVGGSKRVIVTSEAPSAATIWDEPDTSDAEGVSIEAEEIRVMGDIVGGNVVRVEPEILSAAPVKPGWWERIKHLLSR